MLVLLDSSSYQLLCEAMDNFYSKAKNIRKSMGLPAQDFTVEVLQEEGTLSTWDILDAKNAIIFITQMIIIEALPY